MSVTNFINDLIKSDYIVETESNGIKTNSPGRPALVLDISAKAPLVAAIYISRDSCQFALCNLKAQINKHLHFDMKNISTMEEFLIKLEEYYALLVSGLTEPILGIGISSIGPIDKAKGTILNPPDFNGLKNIPIKPFFEKLTTLPVYFDNNMAGAALAEAMFGQGKKLQNFAYLGVTHGVGAGVISNGNLLKGSTGINGEIGHTSIKFDGPRCFCGNRGCLELYTSIPVILEKTRTIMVSEGMLPPDKGLSWNDFVNNVKNEEYYTMKVLNEFCEYLSIAIINMVNLFDCDVIFLGHEIALISDSIETRLTEFVNSRIFSSKLREVQIKKSAFEENAALIGAACFVLMELFEGQLLKC